MVAGWIRTPRGPLKADLHYKHHNRRRALRSFRYVDLVSGTYRGDIRAAVCSGWLSLVSWLSSGNLRRSRASVGVAESILKAALFVLVASTGEKLVARRTGRGATSTRLLSVALKLMAVGARDGKISTGNLLGERRRRRVRGKGSDRARDPGARI